MSIRMVCLMLVIGLFGCATAPVPDRAEGNVSMSLRISPVSVEGKDAFRAESRIEQGRELLGAPAVTVFKDQWASVFVGQVRAALTTSSTEGEPTVEPVTGIEDGSVVGLRVRTSEGKGLEADVRLFVVRDSQLAQEIKRDRIPISAGEEIRLP